MSQTLPNVLTLKEAALLARVSRPTLFRAVQRGELSARTEKATGGKRYLLYRAEVEDWARSREQFEQPYAQSDERVETADWELVEQKNEDEQEVASSDAQFEQCVSLPVKVHLALVEELRVLERKNVALTFELNQHRLSLAENAESIVEQDCRIRQAEAITKVNQEQLEQFERERAELTEKLRQAESRVGWLEQRVPRWVRSMFGAS